MKRALALALITALTLPLAVPVAAAPAPSFRARTPEQEVIYFVLPDRFDNGDPSNDRGGLTGDDIDARHGLRGSFAAGQQAEQDGGPDACSGGSHGVKLIGGL